MVPPQLNLGSARRAAEASGFPFWHLVRLAAKQERIEARWRRRFEKRVDEITDELLLSIEVTRQPNWDLVDFSDTVMNQSVAVMESGMESAERLPPLPSDIPRLAAKPPPEAKIPRSLPKLREMYDLFRRTKKLPPRQKNIAERLRKEYLERIQKAWKQISEPFQRGEIQSRKEIRDAMRDAIKSTKARASTVATTETTYYYNRSRVETYQQSEDVTHYLFVAIRDKATTKWCKTRDGLVYEAKGTYFENETPPCHWNCRSEVLPLTGRNSKQRALIADKGRARSNNRPEPLPAGWTKR